MWDKIIEAAIALFIADKIVKETTDKHIHEHVFGWWCDLRENVKNWLHANSSLGIQQVGVTVLDHLDRLAVEGKRVADKVTLEVFGEDASKRRHSIITREVPLEEAMEKFPSLRQGPIMMKMQDLS
jgi:hypothetical protein